MKKIINTFLIIVIMTVFSFAQNMKEGRVVHANSQVIIGSDIIEVLDNDALSPTAQKLHNDWQRRLYVDLESDLLNILDSLFKENGIDIQAQSTIAAIHSGSENGNPSLIFVKKALKKKGKDADIGEYFISSSLNYLRPVFVKPLKPWNLELSLKIKVYDASGNVVAKISKEIDTEAKIGGVDPPQDEDLFSKISDESAQWFLDHFHSDVVKISQLAVDEIVSLK